MLRLKNILAVAACVIFNVNLQANVISVSDSLALVALYNSTNGEDWVKSDNWLSGPVDTWYGLVCQKGKVEAINLSGNNLNGTLPPELYSLKDLMYVYVSFNSLSGSFDNAIGNLKKLKVLWASNNSISGALPQGIGGCESLKTIYLNNNAITGAIPDTIGSLVNLENLNLAENKLSGKVPETIGKLTNLKYLMLNNNSLGGELPETMCDLSNLQTLRLENNLLTGIPDLTCIPNLVNQPQNQIFTIFNNYFDFTDLAKNKSVLGDESNYFPQRAFTLSTIISLRPGDTINFNMPALSHIDTSDALNTYRYVLGSNEVQPWSEKTNFGFGKATFNRIGTYVCQVKHDSFPGKILPISSVRVLPPSGFSWLSLGVKTDGPLVDTILYSINALRLSGGSYNPATVKDTLLGVRREFLIPTGTYLLQLVPEGKDSVLISKYHKNGVRWANNQESTFANRRAYAYNVTFTEKSFNQGIGSISGKVAESVLPPPAVEAESGSASDSILVMLYSRTLDQWINQQLTAADGSYNFTGLSNGEYAVYIEKPGFIQNDVRSVFVTNETALVDSINYTIYLQDNVIVNIADTRILPSGSEWFNIISQVNGSVKLVFNKPIRERIEVSIFDVTGKRLFAETLMPTEYNELNTSLNKGVFIMQIATGGQKTAKKFLVR